MVQPLSSRLFWDSLSRSVTVQSPTRGITSGLETDVGSDRSISTYFLTQFMSKKPLVEKSNISCKENLS